MKDLVNFFFSFDKLMKDKLVPAFYWSALIYLAIFFIRAFLKGIYLKPLAWLISPLQTISLIVLAFVGLRLLCELAIAIFHINDNLSPDGGVSETADIDPLAEARKAAEEATKKARELTSSAVDKTKAAASNLKDGAEKTADNADDAVKEATNNVKKAAEKIASPKKKSPAKKKTTTSKSSTAKKAPAKKTATKKTSAKKPTPKKKDS